MRKLTALFASAILLVGCNSLEKLKQVKQVALVGVTFNKDFVEIDEKGKDKEAGVSLGLGDLANIASSVSKGEEVKLKKPNPQVEQYLLELKDLLLSKMKGKKIAVKDIDEVKDMPSFKKITYTELQDNMGMSDKYTPKDYIIGNYGNVDTKSTLAFLKENKLDAALFLELAFVKRKKGTLITVVKTEQLGIRAVVTLVNQKDEKIFNYNRYYELADSKVDLNASLGTKLSLLDGFFEDPQTEKEFKQVLKSVGKEFEEDLSEGLK